MGIALASLAAVAPAPNLGAPNAGLAASAGAPNWGAATESFAGLSAGLPKVLPKLGADAAASGIGSLGGEDACASSDSPAFGLLLNPAVLNGLAAAAGSDTFGLPPKPAVLNGLAAAAGSDAFGLPPKPAVLNGLAAAAGSDAFGLPPKPAVLNGLAAAAGSDAFGLPPKPAALKGLAAALALVALPSVTPKNAGLLSADTLGLNGDSPDLSPESRDGVLASSAFLAAPNELPNGLLVADFASSDFFLKGLAAGSTAVGAETGDVAALAGADGALEKPENDAAGDAFAAMLLIPLKPPN